VAEYEIVVDYSKAEVDAQVVVTEIALVGVVGYLRHSVVEAEIVDYLQD
jgi:hypothetical protein